MMLCSIVRSQDVLVSGLAYLPNFCCLECVKSQILLVYVFAQLLWHIFSNYNILQMCFLFAFECLPLQGRENYFTKNVGM